jgi:hypothetical protein
MPVMALDAPLVTVAWASRSLRIGAIGAVGLCVALWVRAKNVDQSERDNAERRAIFVGLWPSMLWLVADSLRKLNATESAAACSD